MTPKLSGIIDQAHLRTSVTEMQAEIKLFSHYYSDHESVTCVLFQQS